MDLRAIIADLKEIFHVLINFHFITNHTWQRRISVVESAHEGFHGLVPHFLNLRDGIHGQERQRDVATPGSILVVQIHDAGIDKSGNL